jgi:hypothetical protein
METKKIVATITLGLSLGAAAAIIHTPTEAQAGCHLFPDACRSCRSCSDGVLGQETCDSCDDDAGECHLSGQVVFCY